MSSILINLRLVPVEKLRYGLRIATGPEIIDHSHTFRVWTVSGAVMPLLNVICASAGDLRTQIVSTIQTLGKQAGRQAGSQAGS